MLKHITYALSLTMIVGLPSSTIAGIGTDWSDCMNLDDARQWSSRLLTASDNGTTDLGTGRETLEAILSEEVKVYSDSNWAVASAVVSNDAPIAKSKEELISGALVDAPSPYKMLDTIISCDYRILHHFVTYLGESKTPVKTFVLWTLRKNPDEKAASRLLAIRMDQEFNSVAWGLSREGWKVVLGNGTEWKV